MRDLSKCVSRDNLFIIYNTAVYIISLYPYQARQLHPALLHRAP